MLILPIIFIFMILFTIICTLITISFILEVFLKAKENYGFVRLHDLAQQLSCIQLGVIGKHDLLLDASRHQSTPSNIFISKVSLQISIKILNAFLITLQVQFAHRKMVILFDNFLNSPFLDLSFNYELFLCICLILKLLELLLYILDYCLCFVLLFCKNERKVHQTSEIIPLLIIVELLSRNQTQNHATEQIKNLLFFQFTLFFLILIKKWYFLIRPLEQKLRNFGEYFWQLFLI